MEIRLRYLYKVLIQEEYGTCFSFLVQFFCRNSSCDQESSISSATGDRGNHVTSMIEPLSDEFRSSFIDPGPYVIIIDSSSHNSIISGESNILIPLPPYSEQGQVFQDPPPEYSSVMDWLWTFCNQKHAYLLLCYGHIYVCVGGVTCRWTYGLK